MAQYRDLNGRFAKVSIKVTILILAMATVLAIAYAGLHTNTKYVTVDKIISVDTAKIVVEKNRKEVLDLLEKCESNGVATKVNWEDYGTGKNRASFGSYQFKVGTIQKFRKDLNDFQAIALAGDRDQSRALASEIIFNTQGGIWNWKNCMMTYKLDEKVKFIKQLESEI